MKLTYADALLHLPVDAMLQSYLTQQGMVFAPDFDWADDPGTRERLITEIQTCPDTAVRDKVVAGLEKHGVDVAPLLKRKAAAGERF